MRPTNPIPDMKNAEAFRLIENIIDNASTDEPIILGITGAGGAGKTTLARNIVRYYGKDVSMTIDLDDYLISRKKRAEAGLTGYDPRANRLTKARHHLLELKSGNYITKPRYDHRTGCAMDPEIIYPARLIIIEGVTALYPELIELNDIALFLDALEETQIRSRIERDIDKRGYSKEEAIALYEKTRPDYLKYIAPAKKDADIVFAVSPDYIMRQE